MIDFTDKTYANLLRAQLERVTDDVDKRETSLINTALGPASWTIEGFYLILAQLQQNSNARTAVGQALDDIVATRGIKRNPATPATYEGRFNVAVPIGARFSTITGGDSVVFFVKSAMDSPDNFFHYEMECEVPGTIGNGQITGDGQTNNLLPITFVSDLTFARLIALLIAGTEEEGDEPLRQRFFDSLRNLPTNGNIASYRSFILSQENIGAVQVYPAWQGGGTVLCSILDGNFDSATPALVEIIQNLVCPPEDGDVVPSPLGFGIAPVGAQVTISTASPLQVDIDMTIQLSSGATIPGVAPLILQALSNYLLLVRMTWGNALITNKVVYPVYVYLSQINALVLQIEGIVNITGTMLNGSTSDLDLTQTGELQEIPVLGEVTVNGQVINNSI
jgi:uncharacterized phage protein gp47/JayE